MRASSTPATNPLSRRRFLAAGASTLGALALPRRLAAQDDADAKAVDSAIAQGLHHLARQQMPSGAWRAPAFGGDSTAATSLALMAFMAAGHVPGEGPYAPLMERGIRWVLQHQENNGLLIGQRHHQMMYDHGISALMLAEIIGMVGEDLEQPVRSALEAAVRLILTSQSVRKDAHHAGGWRYHPSANDSDLSVTGWQLLALRAAKNDGCDVPADAIDQAVAYVKRCSTRDNFGFCYQPGQGPTATRTGTGITCLEVCGEHNSEEALGGAEYLRQRPLRRGETFFYYGAYYCSVGLFKLGERIWEEAKPQLTRLLLAEQSFDGSWQAGRGGEQSAGDVYCTALAVLALAVEYQYLPIYQR